MRNVLRWSAILIFVHGTVVACKGQQASKEELTVRAMYARFVIGSDVSSMRRGDKTGLLSIQLSEFRGGSIDAIMNERIDELLTIPSGEVLMSSPGLWSLNEEKGLCATVDEHGWRPFSARYTGTNTVDWHAPVSALVKGHTVDRFAAYSASVFYGGKKREYRALALLSSGRDATPPFVVDYMLDGSIVSSVAGVGEGDFRRCVTAMPNLVDPPRKGIVAEFIESLRVSPDCEAEEYTGLCCEPNGAKCGIPVRVR